MPHIAPERKYFTKSKRAIPLPDLIEVQKKSYKWFFEVGLKELFEEISPIKDFIGRNLELYFEGHYLDEPKFDEVTARSKNITFEAPLRVKAKLVNERTGEVNFIRTKIRLRSRVRGRGSFGIGTGGR